jgi:predicted Zn-ribbon and HTH transcriptional regulator
MFDPSYNSAMQRMGFGDAPNCAKCGLAMTPENAKRRPELFLHDDCLPDELRIPQGNPAGEDDAGSDDPARKPTRPTFIERKAFDAIMRWCDRGGEEPEGQCLHEIEQICRKQLGLDLLQLSEPLRCPECGYTKEDAAIHGDHGLCLGKTDRESVQVIAGYPIKLLDRADGCKGHFCLGRQRNPPYWEFWSETYNGGSWCSAGTLFSGREAAQEKLAELAEQQSLSDLAASGGIVDAP